MRFLATALLCGLMACSQNAPRVALGPRVLPPIPTSIASQLGPVPVLFVDVIRASDVDSTTLVGAFDSWTRKIYIRKDLAFVQQWQIFFHESAHVWLHDSGLSEMLHPNMTNAICDAFGSAQVAAMLAMRR